MFKQMNAVTILLAATLTITPAATAQTGTHYTRRAADTLRYREVSTGHMRVRTPEGQDVPLETEHEALIAVTFGPADTLRAWYDSLAIGLVGPGGATRPATQTVLHQPFLLRFDPRGHTETLATPAFPASFNGVTDLTRQFDDFFLRLPEGDLNRASSGRIPSGSRAGEPTTTRCPAPGSATGWSATPRLGRHAPSSSPPTSASAWTVMARFPINRSAVRPPSRARTTASSSSTPRVAYCSGGAVRDTSPVR